MNKITTILVFLTFFNIANSLLRVQTVYPLPADEVIPLVDEEYYPAVHKALTNAKKSILCIMYMAKIDPKYTEGDEYQLVLDLINAHKRGVKVLVVFDQNIKFWGKSKKTDVIERKSKDAYDLLLRNGVPVFYDNKERVTHSKILVIDQYITVIGSTNWTYSALRKNHEASVMIKSKSVALTFEKKLKKNRQKH
jgi:phosphatidylserine/phosphatidylglycerophosphate/cardiolipin synthase-like enzyme